MKIKETMAAFPNRLLLYMRVQCVRTCGCVYVHAYVYACVYVRGAHMHVCAYGRTYERVRVRGYLGRTCVRV